MKLSYTDTPSRIGYQVPIPDVQDGESFIVIIKNGIYFKDNEVYSRRGYTFYVGEKCTWNDYWVPKTGMIYNSPDAPGCIVEIVDA